MSDSTVRPDSVNVDQIMEQIRARIREKRGADFSEPQIHELADAKLDAFLDPRVVRPEVLEQFRRARAARPAAPRMAFEEGALFNAQRPIVAKLRRLLHPILRLLFNPDPISEALLRINEIDPMVEMQLELIRSLVVELTRTGIEVTNLKMRVESLAARLEFNERRARALERMIATDPGASVVVSGATAGSSPSPMVDQPTRSGGSYPSPRSGAGHAPQSSRPSFSPARPASPARTDSARTDSAGPTPGDVAARESSAGSTAAQPVSVPGGPALPSGQPTDGAVPRSRRRRRRRGRRGGAGPHPSAENAPGTTAPADSPASDASDASVDEREAADEIGGEFESHDEPDAQPHDEPHDQAGANSPSSSTGADHGGSGSDPSSEQ